MIVGYLIVGMLIGVIAAAISLFAGSSLLLALAVYSVGGILGLLLFATFFHYIWPRVTDPIWARRKKIAKNPHRSPY